MGTGSAPLNLHTHTHTQRKRRNSYYMSDQIIDCSGIFIVDGTLDEPIPATITFVREVVTLGT